MDLAVAFIGRLAHDHPHAAEGSEAVAIPLLPVQIPNRVGILLVKLVRRDVGALE